MGEAVVKASDFLSKHFDISLLHFTEKLGIIKRVYNTLVNTKRDNILEHMEERQNVGF